MCSVNFFTTEYKKLTKVLLSPPDYLSIQNPLNVIAQKNKEMGLTVNIKEAKKEHKEFVDVFNSYGVEVLLGETRKECVESLYARDLGVASKKGIIFGRFLEPARWGEHRLIEDVLYKNNIPVFYKLDRGNFEGGDFVYIDDMTAAVGVGPRTDMLGFKALQMQLYDIELNLIPVKIEKEYLHLDKILNVIAENLAIICLKALPENLIKLLKKRNFTFIEVSSEEVFNEACNLINIGQDTIFSHPGAEKVNKRLKTMGFNVEILNFKEVFKGGGGLRCMSFPLLSDG